MRVRFEGSDGGFAGMILLRLLQASWRLDYRKPPEGRAGRVRGLPVLFCLWHGRQLALTLTHRGEGVTNLISMHGDGEYAARVAGLLGYSVVRGSSTRGGVEALRRMASVLRSGGDCAITPDGPRGPAFRAKPGLVQIARLGRRPVVPIGASGSPSAVFRSWDSFRLPLPFARVVVVEGRPLPPPPRSVAPDQAALQVEREIARVTRLSDFLASPSGRLFELLSEAAGRSAGAAASAVLLSRPPGERAERNGRTAPRTDGPVWMHGSSVGEINGILPYAGHLASRGIPVHLTAFTPAGREAVANSGFTGSFLPLDSPGRVERFLDAIRPGAFVLAETELWPNLLLGTLLRSIPCFSVNARLSRTSLRNYRLLAGSCPGTLLSCFCSIMCRSPEDAERFAMLGVDPAIIEVAGDAKALRDPGDPPSGWTSRLASRQPVLVAGSTRPGEERAVALAAREAGFFPVIVPRHLERLGEVMRLLAAEGLDPALWSGEDIGCGCLVVDCRGMLSRLYGCAAVAFVGGTIAPFGGHNILEPMLRGVPVVVGPSHQSFATEVDAGVSMGAVRVTLEAGLAEAMTSLRESRIDPERIRELGRSRGREALARFDEGLRRAGVWT